MAKDPFCLISTGTWSISLNAFNRESLTPDELRQDCLCYLDDQGESIKASRWLAGPGHDQELVRLARQFQVPESEFRILRFEPALAHRVLERYRTNPTGASDPALIRTEWNRFPDYATAYHGLMFNLVREQVMATRLALGATPVRHLWVDGGFGRNQIFMNWLAAAFPSLEVAAAVLPQASALGAALIVHEGWNRLEPPAEMIRLQPFLPPTGLRMPIE
jgi:sugar (pentulose or hexulose) kinase